MMFLCLTYALIILVGSRFLDLILLLVVDAKEERHHMPKTCRYFGGHDDGYLSKSWLEVHE
jgi:hypothetical protein